MNTSALIMMISVVSIVIIVSAYFFIKVLTTKPKAEPDSYSENDDVPR
jgi:heme/copper-type cytochrome/quinol oxidase subunit 2